MREGSRCGVFRVSRGVLIGVFRLSEDRGEVQVKHWELLLASKSLLVSSRLPGCAWLEHTLVNLVEPCQRSNQTTGVTRGGTMRI